MGQIDFVQQQRSDDSNGQKPKPRYDIEYTNPEGDSGPVQPEKKFNWFGLKRSNDKVLDVQLKQQPAAPVAQPLPKPQPLPKSAVAQPVVAKPVTPVPAPAAPTPLAVPTIQASRTVVTPQAAEAALPVMPTPVATPIVRKPVPTTPAPVKAPVMPKPVQPAAPATAAPAVAGAPLNVNTDGIVARNVSHVKGAETNPEPISRQGLEVNLLPTDLFNAMNPLARVTALLKTALVTSVLVGLGYGVMLGYQSYYLYQTRSSQLEIQSVDKEINTYADLQNDLTDTTKRLTDIGAVLTHHQYWSNVLTVLEKNTLPNVYYTSLSASTTGLISVQGITTDYASVTEQILSYRSAHWQSDTTIPLFTSVRTDTITRSDVTAVTEATDTATTTPVKTTDTTTTPTPTASVVTFSLSMQVDPSVLTYHNPYELQQ